ncbi:MAG: family 43 glycosylhydrolase [Lachnospiraceae bacterium]|nr:family 43 glycosylhydrolase [Lachnospiraceae bacterium]
MEKINGKLNEYNTPWIIQRADPYVCRHTDGIYYFTATVPAYDKIILRKSDTLTGLAGAEEKVIWNRHTTGAMGSHIWAPELHYLDGAWYIYFAAGDAEEVWKIRPYVLKCEGQNPMTDDWVEMGQLQCADEDEFSFRSFSLDATILESAGKYYIVWAEKVGVGKGISNLYIAELESPTKLKTVQVLLTTPDYDWERIGFWVNEGPAVLKHDGRIFLTYSASATGACYAMGMLSAREGADLLDPAEWRKERCPVLSTDEEKGIYGPGHNSFVKAEDGRDVCVYHARTYEEIEGDPLHDPNRHAMLLEVTWRDGRPVFDFANKIQ